MFFFYPAMYISLAMLKNSTYQQSTIGKVAEIHSGFTLRKGSVGEGKMYTIIQVNDLTDNFQIDPEKIEKKVITDPSDQYLMQKKDILFISKGENNYAALSKSKIRDVIVSNSFLIIRDLRPQLIPEYLTWFINSDQGQQEINEMRRGNTVPYIPKSALMELPVLIPPIEVQRKIVEIRQLQEKELKLREKISEMRKNLVNACLLGHLNKTSARPSSKTTVRS